MNGTHLAEKEGRRKERCHWGERRNKDFTGGESQSTEERERKMKERNEEVGEADTCHQAWISSLTCSRGDGCLTTGSIQSDHK
jgi:hypothetical protein